MRRLSALVAAFVVALLGGVFAFAPAASATGSTLQSPAAVGMMGELSGSLTPAQSAAMAQIANTTTIGSGATPAVVLGSSGRAVLTGAAAAGTSAEAAGLGLGATLGTAALVAPFVPLVVGGIADWGVQVPADTSGLPTGVSGSGFAQGGTYLSGTPSIVGSVVLTNQVWASGQLVAFDWTAPAGTSQLTPRCLGSSYPRPTVAELASLLDGARPAYGNGVYVNSVAQPTTKTSGHYGPTSSSPGIGNCLASSLGDFAGFQVSGTYGGTFGASTLVVEAPTVDASPNRWIEQTVTCTDGSGTPHTSTLTGSPAEWASGAFIGVLGLLCPSGEYATDYEATVKTEGGADVEIAGGTSPDVSSIPSECLVGTSVVCGVKLQRRTGEDTWTDCLPGVTPNPCTRWAESPNRTTDYRCMYGATTFIVVQLASCGGWKRVFDPAPPEDPTPEYDPPLNGDPTDGFCSLGWGDVLTGAIVFKAVGCALQWAFVPSEETLTTVQAQISSAWDGTAPAVLIESAGEVGAPLRDLSEADDTPDCLGPEVDWDWGFLPHAHPFSNCESLPATLATYFKPIFGAAVLLLALGTSVRTLGNTIGVSKPGAV